jgi:hypothetical protein
MPARPASAPPFNKSRLVVLLIPSRLLLSGNKVIGFLKRGCQSPAKETWRRYI